MTDFLHVTFIEFMKMFLYLHGLIIYQPEYDLTVLF